jgi:hypothetical protein
VRWKVHRFFGHFFEGLRHRKALQRFRARSIRANAPIGPLGADRKRGEHGQS